MWLRIVPALLVAAAPLRAQRVIDEATFSFTRAGAPYGTETFKILQRRGSDGMELVAQSTRTIDGRVLRAMLTTDSAGDGTAYTRSSTGSGQLTARRALNRLTVNEEGPPASSRDYVFTPGSVILDEDVIVPLYFVTRRDARELGYVNVAGREAGRAALTEVGRENLDLGSGTVAATRYALGSGGSRREIWVDSERRLLKIAHPAQQVVGIRDRPPR